MFSICTCIPACICTVHTGNSFGNRNELNELIFSHTRSVTTLKIVCCPKFSVLSWSRGINYHVLCCFFFWIRATLEVKKINKQYTYSTQVCFCVNDFEFNLVRWSAGAISISFFFLKCVWTHIKRIFR